MRSAAILPITIAQAEAMVGAAKRRAAEIGVPASIMVHDHGAHMLAFARMDGAFLGSIDIAGKKARTSVLFGLETQETWSFARPDGPAHGVEQTNGTLVTFPGGVPIRSVGQVLVGAIGVSGGLPDQDYEIAQAGAAAFRAG